MIPAFGRTGDLPPGIHKATWADFETRFGTTAHRRRLLSGLKKACLALKAASCRTLYIDGSFVTAKKAPNDFDGCWSLQETNLSKLDPVLKDLSHGRAAQKAKYLGELFPAELPEGETGKSFLAFFQTDRRTGSAKGIVELNLEEGP